MKQYKYIILVVCLAFSVRISAQQLVLIETTLGNMTVKLYDDTPIHTANFLKLVKESYYDSTIFHRIIKNFMIQGGDPQSKTASMKKVFSNGGPGYTLEAEINEKYIHKKGALAAARQPDNVNFYKKSNGSQFYIIQGSIYPRKYLSAVKNDKKIEYTENQKKIYETIGGSPHLDGGYTIFGEVVKGLSIIDKIASNATNSKDRPLTDIRILKMTILN